MQFLPDMMGVNGRSGLVLTATRASWRIFLPSLEMEMYQFLVDKK